MALMVSVFVSQYGVWPSGCACGTWDGQMSWMGRDTLLGPEGSDIALLLW